MRPRSPRVVPRRRRASRGQRVQPRRAVPPRIGIVGLGYVGVPTAAAFADHGLSVVGYDTSAERRAALRAGRVPFFEPGLLALVRSSRRSGRFHIVESPDELVQAADLVFLCLPTPSGSDGRVNVDFVLAGAEAIGRALGGVGGWRSVVVKSTVPPGTTVEQVAPRIAQASGRAVGDGFGVAANPEFLAEGSAVEDAVRPSRIVVGTSEARTLQLLRAAYRKFPAPLVELSPTEAELTKYAANAMLASRVSFVNEIARLAEAVGADVYRVMGAVGQDPRVGARFLDAGPGFGGSCFSKDLNGLLVAARDRGVNLPVTRAVLEVNEGQPVHVVDMAERSVGTLQGRTVALLGLSFKANTDDVRESRAYPILAELLRRGARVRLHDPRAGPSFLAGLPEVLKVQQEAGFHLVSSVAQAVEGADLAVIQADWPEYRRLPAAAWMPLAARLVVDARRSVDPERLGRAGIRWVGVGRRP